MLVIIYLQMFKHGIRNNCLLSINIESIYPKTVITVALCMIITLSWCDPGSSSSADRYRTAGRGLPIGWWIYHNHQVWQRIGDRSFDVLLSDRCCCLYPGVVPLSPSMITTGGVGGVFLCQNHHGPRNSIKMASIVNIYED